MRHLRTYFVMHEALYGKEDDAESSKGVGRAYRQGPRSGSSAGSDPDLGGRHCRCGALRSGLAHCGRDSHRRVGRPEQGGGVMPKGEGSGRPDRGRVSAAEKRPWKVLQEYKQLWLLLAGGGDQDAEQEEE